MSLYSVIITREWHSKQIVYLPYERKEPYGDPLNEAMEWDGRGFAFVRDDLMDDRLIQSRPEVGDVIEIDGYNYVVIGRDIMMQGYRVMRESLAAHRLAMFYLTYWSDLAAHYWQIQAFRRLFEHHIQGVEDMTVTYI